jgi:hypothetical protein
MEALDAFPRKIGESAIELASWFLTRMLGLDRHLRISVGTWGDLQRLLAVVRNFRAA